MSLLWEFNKKEKKEGRRDKKGKKGRRNQKERRKEEEGVKKKMPPSDFKLAKSVLPGCSRLRGNWFRFSPFLRGTGPASSPDPELATGSPVLLCA